MIIVTFRSRLIRSSRFMTATWLRVSRSATASSSSIRRGALASERAIATRCCSPPDSSDGKWLILSSKPTIASSIFARAVRSCLLSSPSTDMGSSTFSNALSAPSSWND
mmetsp:Transcript_342/g.1169  ORF Transcript_342/g.1169 Transcript_342/m.1169 type:complete len:109 (+) Transcript_342:211-537(+)